MQEIVSEDDHEEKALQSDAEKEKKATVNDGYTLPSVVTTGKTQQKYTQNMTTDAPLHDECVTAVQDKLFDVSDERCRTKNGCLSRSMTLTACNKIVRAASAPTVTLHVRLTPETKDSIDKEPLIKMPKRATLTNAARPERVHEAETLEVLSARADFGYLSDVPARDNTDLKACEESSVVTMHTPEQNVNAVAELVFDMMMTSEFEVAGRSSVFYTMPS